MIKLIPLTHSCYPKWFYDQAITLGMVHDIRDKQDNEAYLQETNKSDNLYAFGINSIEESNSLYIGNCSLKVNWRHRSAEIGIVIWDKNSHGKGYGTQVITELSDIAFKTFGIHRCWAGILEINEASIKAFKKAGYRGCGRKKEAIWKEGRFVDVIEMEKLEDKSLDSIKKGIEQANNGEVKNLGSFSKFTKED